MVCSVSGACRTGWRRHREEGRGVRRLRAAAAKHDRRHGAGVSMLAELKDDPNVAFVQPAEIADISPPQAALRLRPRGPRRRPPARSGRPRCTATARDVLIGIIDVGGFDFAHPDFLDEDGETRFVSIWDQRGGRRQPPDVRDLDYGSEITQAHMNAAIAAAKKPGVPPATMLERQSQTTPGSHGTHVASIAAGKSGVCPEAHIAAVLIDVPCPRIRFRDGA